MPTADTLLAPHKLLRRAHLLLDFLAVAETGTIRSAAQRQHLSQSALTRRIQDLESGLGVELFERHPHGMTLTKFGEALQHHAHLVGLTCDYAVGEINDLLGGGTGELRVAAGPAWVYELVPDAMAALQARMPRVRIHLSSGLNETTLPMLSEGRLDAVLGGLPPRQERDGRLVYEPLLNVEHRLFASRSHPLAGRSGLRPRDLVDVLWIWFSESVTGRQFSSRWFERAGMTLPPPSVETSALQAGFRLLQAAQHVMLLPSTLTALAAQHGLAPLHTREPVGVYTSGLMYRPSVLRLQAFAGFREQLQQRVVGLDRP
ncbi:MAG: LysR family transcriptional regulator [Burkholderiales bacterium]|nr:LysR family transcriptional regulator [Burkholderiales bacterium]